ncbi:hypothetical protein C0Q70_14598 [Pomacea canaliculata]|uniref:Vesicular, overexpressed in cancer, prosurvival protein 1 n=1 Tax=Pomacea canaliculata TaxID=400727 RepID=A0A2T7NSJ9_POMCA|nr:uncharacterized protein LOC112572241 [Pomacea canaliculata]PVD24128.1 hypothetical protein C0Q70_14598 [Pomacea canaliculata]
MAATSHLVAFLTLVTGTLGWKCAKYRHYFSQQPDYIDCMWDCCGNSFNRHCCAPIAIIVGCAICGAVVLAAIVVFLCCFWQRRRQRYGDTSNLFRYRRPQYHPPASSVVVQPAPYVAYGQKAPPPPDQFFQ